MKLISPAFSPLLAAAFFIPAATQAAELAYEGFDYPVGIANTTGQLGGHGWNGVWRTVNNGSADIVSGSLLPASAPAGYDLRAVGNSCFLPNNRRVGRRVDTSLTGPFGTAGYRDANGRIGADGKTIYISFTQQPNATGSYYEFEFHRGDLGDPGRIAGIGNDQGGTNVNLRAPNGTHTVIGPGDTNVNFYVVRIDFKNGNDDVRVYRNPTSATEPASPTLLKELAADMSFDGISFGAFVGSGRVVTHDEVRLGETWEDVTVPPPAQPAFAEQPHPTTSYAGGTVLLKARATGQPLPAYQWFKGVNPISGQTGATLTLSNVQPGDAGSYHVTATNTGGVAVSSDAQVNVIAAPAGLLAYEGFDYTPGTGNLPGKPGGLGWGAPWTNVDAGGVNVQSGNLLAGTNGPNGFDDQSLGNSAFTPNNQRDGRLLDTTPGGRLGTAGYIDGSGNVGADGKTIYLSFVQQPDGTSKFYEFEFHRGNLGDPGRIGGIGNDTGNPTVALRTGGTTTLIGPGSTGVNLYVVRIDFKPGNDDVYVYQNPVSATEPAVATLTKIAASDMSFNGLSIAAFDSGRTVKHDEIRVGQNWSDVIFGTSRRELVWVGDGTANEWNLTAANWTAGSGSTAFVDGDPVTFDDTGSDSPAVNVTTSVNTASLTVNNELNDYTLGGVGTIITSGGLVKSGAGSLTLNGTANLSSALVVNGGDVQLNGTFTGGGGLNVNAGTTTLAGTSSLNGLVSTNGNLSITGPTAITGGAPFVWIGNFPGADSTMTIDAGGSLTMTGALADSLVFGRDGGSGALIQNGGTLTYNPTNRAEAYLGASTSPATTASYTMNDGTLEMSEKRLALALGPVTSRLTQNGGAIHVRQLDLGSTLPAGPGTGILDLTGGILTIGAGGITSGSGQSEINLGHATVAAAADWSSIRDMTLTGTGGSTTFDTSTFEITLGGFLSGDGGLIKIGTGTLVLNGFNAFTGPLAVNAGTLAGIGSIDSDLSSLTVASGATLAPGDGGIGFFFSAGPVDLASGSTFAVEIDSSFTTSDQLAAANGIDLTGANVTFAEIGTGIISAGTELVLIDYSGGIRTGTFTGYPEGATVAAGSNTFTINYANASRVTLTSTTVLTAYQSWAISKGLDDSPGKESAFDLDPERDGFSNGLEWVLGGDPLAVDQTPLVAVTSDATTGITLAFTREEASLGNVTLTVEWDTDLGGIWTSVPITQAGGSHPGGVTVGVNQAATPDAVTVNIPASNSANGHLFARLRATMP
jgi:autotransporter-associated beta strand protein